MPARKSTRPRSPRASARQKIETERRQLLRASAILTGAALAAQHDVDRDVVADAISVGREFVDDAVDALDSIALSKTTLRSKAHARRQ
jgi:hypothetical protein